MTPSNPLSNVRRLAENEENCTLHAAVLEELRRYKMDSDDLRDILKTELGEIHCFKTKATEKYYPATISDYYSYWVDTCGRKMFIKLLITNLGTATEHLVVTSFKKDNNYG